jgi:hypothetical protein
MARPILRALLVFVFAVDVLPHSELRGQSIFLPIDHELNSRLGNNVNALSSKVHTSIQPMELSHLGGAIEYDSLLASGRAYNYDGKSWLERKIFSEHLLERKTEEYHLSLDFLPDLGLGKDFVDGRMPWLNTRGFEFAGNIGKEFAFRTQYFESLATFPSYLNRFIKLYNVVPGQGYRHDYSEDQHDYGYASGTISCSPSQYLNIQFGQDKNFIGDGYRSMLLSDIGSNYPFLKLTGYVWDLQYTIMWAQFQDLMAKPLSENLGWQKKYGVFHYLDWNITDRLSLGLFEAVIWKNVDSAGYRGFELNYLNPIIFFRPVEFSLGSPDNMLLGLNVKYKMTDHWAVYGQLMIDEMTYDEYLKNRGWWGNKNAFQVGMKGFDLFNVNQLSFQTEVNSATPYTYSHWESLTNYGHYNQSLAHPLGANFYEWVSIGRYSVQRFEFRVQVNLARYGEDSANVNYGKDIFKSYDTRAHDYGNYTTQGVKTNLTYVDCRISYIFNPVTNLRFELGAVYRSISSDVSSERSTLVTLGLRSSFRNLYYDF